MDYKKAQKELRLSNYPENTYLYYKATSIIENIVKNTKDKEVLFKVDLHLQELKKLENPFNFDKTVKSESGLSRLMDIVAEVESYLESIE